IVHSTSSSTVPPGSPVVSWPITWSGTCPRAARGRSPGATGPSWMRWPRGWPPRCRTCPRRGSSSPTPPTASRWRTWPGPPGSSSPPSARTSSTARPSSRPARMASALPAVPPPGVVAADATDRESLEDLARSTRVVITPVGPYLEYGEPLVAACAEAGTDYVDLAGEPEFVDRMYLEHQDAAVASGARIVHACGFDSIPHDLEIGRAHV